MLFGLPDYNVQYIQFGMTTSATGLSGNIALGTGTSAQPLSTYNTTVGSCGSLTIAHIGMWPIAEFCMLQFPACMPGDEPIEQQMGVPANAWMCHGANDNLLAFRRRVDGWGCIGPEAILYQFFLGLATVHNTLDTGRFPWYGTISFLGSYVVFAWKTWSSQRRRQHISAG